MDLTVNSRQCEVARPLAEGLPNRTVCRNDTAEKLMPGPLRSVEEAIQAAVGKLAAGEIETRWSGEMWETLPGQGGQHSATNALPW